MLDAATTMDLAQMSIWTLIMVITPIMLVALVVGLIVALFQALTSIQEMTLTFVPKILAVFVVLILTLPFMGDQMLSLGTELFSRIAAGG